MPQLPTKFTRDDVVIESCQTCYQGFFRLDKIRFHHPLFNGGVSATVQREVFERGDAVVVLAYDPQRDAVVFVEQLRIAALRTADNPWQLELVAGIIDAGETAEAVARRELLEESGLTARTIQKICSYLPSPGACSERHTLYLAIVDINDERQLFGLADEHEDIRRHVVLRTEALAWLEQGKIDNAPTIIGLQWLALHHAQWTRA